MNARLVYETTRRAYRASCRVSLLQDGSIEARNSALFALRAITGKLDDCAPARMLWQQSQLRRTQQNSAIYSPTVWAACTRFLKSH